MKKLISLFLVSVVATQLLAGCGSNGNDKNEKGQTVITVGGWPEEDSAQYENMMSRKTKFEEDNPDVVIEPDMWKFDRKTFYAKASGGQLPIVYNAGYTEIQEIIDSEYSADLTDVLKKKGYTKMFNSSLLDALSRDGRIYAIPKSVSLMGLMFNTELFEAAGLLEADGTPKQPKDWDEVAQFAVQIKEKTGKAGFVIPTTNNSGGWLFTPIAWSYGVKFIDKDKDGNWKATFNTPEAAQALQYIKDLKWKYDVLPSTTLINADEWRRIFGVGEAAITFGAGDYPARGLYKYGTKPEQIGLMAMPAGPKEFVTILSGDILCVSKEATKDQIDAAVRWIEGEITYEATDAFKTNLENNIKLYRENGQIVGIKGMSLWNKGAEATVFEHKLTDENINTNPNYLKLYNEFAENCPCEIRPEEPVCTQELYGILDKCIQEVLTNKDADCAAILEKANSDFQKDYLDNI